MNVPSDDDQDMLAAYALDAVDDEERIAIENALADSPQGQAAVDRFRQTAAAGLGQPAAQEPPPEVRDRVLAAIGETPQVPVSLDDRRPRWIAPALAAAAVALIALVGGLLIQSRDSALSVDELAEAPGAVTADLDGLTAESDGSVSVIWSAGDGKAAVVADGLADAGEGQVYALWAVVGDEVTPAGLFSVSAGGVEQIFDVTESMPDGWGITIEPAGGSPQPTGDILYLGLL